MWALDPGQNARDLDNVRFIGALMGRYLLASRRARREGVRVFACRLQSISPTTLVVSGPVAGEPGEEVATMLSPFGLLRGQVNRLIDDGFVIDIDANDDERKRLARRIEWYKRRTYQGVEDKRKHRRFMPRDSRSMLVMRDGQVIDCLIIDMSQSGVAVSADIQPPIGTPLAVGAVVGRVVRQLEVGFAVQFADEQDIETLEHQLRPAIASV